jgi:pimeloyl-ACP methyl ester carboxylesterase
MAGSPVGYAHQLLAASVWSSLFALPLIRQPTLIVAGTDDPIIPVANARIMGRLLPHATMHLHTGGHVDPVTNPAEFAPLIESFRHGECESHLDARSAARPGRFTGSSWTEASAPC